MPISVNPSGIQMNDGNTLSRSQASGLLPNQLTDASSLLTIKAGLTFDGDTGITTSADPSFRLTKGDNVYTNFALINATSSWTVPPGVTKGLVVVIGGGGSGGSGFSVGGDTPYSNAGGAGGRGGAGSSFIPLVSGNSMPAVVGGVTGTSSFFGIVATGGTNGSAAPTFQGAGAGAPGNPGTSSTGNFLNGQVSVVYPTVIDFVDANSYGVIDTFTPSLQTHAFTNTNVPGGGYAASTLYAFTDTVSAGAGGTPGTSSPFGGSPAGAGRPGAVVVFY